MSEPFIGEIRIFAGNFAIRNWAFCDGALISISQNTALFSLLGTTYGGDGENNFALPDLRGRAAMHQGTGPGLTPRTLGSRSGTGTVALNTNHIANHNHLARGSENPGNDSAPAGNYVARGAGRGANTYIDNSTAIGTSKQLRSTGGSAPHNNMQPYLALNCIIALIGLYPSQN